ncbi:MAG: dihydrodipicolinate reductase [Pseudomonadota bacterium]
MTHRIIIWGTGFVGARTLRAVLENPAYELAGVIVSNPDKDGIDAGVLSGGEPVGVAASTNADEVLARDAHAVAYFGPSAMYAEQNIENFKRALSAGKNVIDTSMGGLIHPATAPAEMTEPIAAACATGGVSFLSTGIDPGFANTLFPLALMGLAGRVDTVRIQEIIDFGTYPVASAATTMGLGLAPGEPAMIGMPGVATLAWGAAMRLIADKMGVVLERVDEVYEQWFTEDEIVYPTGVVKPGHCGAAHTEIQGVVAGEPRIFIDHYHRMAPQAAPDWPKATLSEIDTYRVEIKGSPNIVQETTFRDAVSGDGNAGGCLATGMHAIHLVPALVDAPPGLFNVAELPLAVGRGVFDARAEMGKSI